MIIFTLRIKVPAMRRRDFLDSARRVTGPTAVQPGCISCRFYQDLDDSDAILFIEEWESRVDLDRRIKSREYRIILELMELSSVPPQIRLNTVSTTEGLEAIETLRS